MNIWLCFWTAISGSGNSVSMLWPWLVRAGFFSLLLAVLSSAGMLLRRSDMPITFAWVRSTTRLLRAYVAAFLSQTLRKKSSGLVRIAPLLFLGTVTAMLAVTLYASYRNPGNSKIVELHNVKVLRDIGRYDYWFQSEDGTKFYSTFCADYEPQFSAGQTLIVLKYEDKGACWSVANTHPAYLIQRGQDGRPTKD